MTTISLDDVLDAATQTRYPVPTGETYSPHWAIAMIASNGDAEVLP